MTVQLGDEVKDTITGYNGIAVCKHTYLQGCDRITVQPKVSKTDPVPAEASFDEPQLIVTKAKAVVGNGDTTKGGPARYMPKPKPT